MCVCEDLDGVTGPANARPQQRDPKETPKVRACVPWKALAGFPAPRATCLCAFLFLSSFKLRASCGLVPEAAHTLHDVRPCHAALDLATCPTACGAWGCRQLNLLECEGVTEQQE